MPPKLDPNAAGDNANVFAVPAPRKEGNQKFKNKGQGHQPRQQDDRSQFNYPPGKNLPNSRPESPSNMSATSSVAELSQRFYDQLNVDPQWQSSASSQANRNPPKPRPRSKSQKRQPQFDQQQLPQQQQQAGSHNQQYQPHQPPMQQHQQQNQQQYQQRQSMPQQQQQRYQQQRQSMPQQPQRPNQQQQPMPQQSQIPQQQQGIPLQKQRSVPDQLPQQQRPSGRKDLVRDGISSDQIQAVSECPVCFDVPRKPIYNCETGHIICGRCRDRIHECPLCRKGYSDSRNYVVENLLEHCTFKCDYTKHGCVARYSLDEEEDHKDGCNFRPLGCEVFPCKHGAIDYTDFLPHLRSKHHSQTGPGTNGRVTREVYVKNIDKLMQQGCRPPYLIHGYGSTFLQYTQAVGNKMWFWVSLLGTPEEASRYKVTLALFARDRELRNTWTGPVHSVRHSGDDIYFNGLCMVTTEECIKAFFHRHPDNFPVYNMEIVIERIR